MREFNVTGICVPEVHYMVDISEKVEKIFALVEAKKYFTINRGRQFGKTTAILMLEKRLPEDYICASLSFQFSGKEMFADEAGFCRELLNRIHRALSIAHKEEAKLWLDDSVTTFSKLEGVQEAVKLILDENSTLFDDMVKKVEEHSDLRNITSPSH